MNTNDELLIETFHPPVKSLRVAIVTETFPPEVNGVAMTLGRLVDGLLERGNAVQMVRPRQAVDHLRESRVGMEEVLSRGIALPAYGDLRFGLPASHRLARLWTQRRPDVVHVVTEGPLGWSAVSAARKLGLPLTSSFHTNFQSYSQHYGIGLLKSPIEVYLRKLHNRTMATLVPTKEMQVELQRRGYENVVLLSRGVDTQLFNPAKRSEQLRLSWGAGPNDPVVILVGRLAREKNVGLVLTAFRALQARIPNARLVFVGDGPLRSQLQSQCPDAHFCGTRKGEDLAAHYASGDLFLFPSMTETFGNVVPEAIASGLAVVAFDTAAARELIVSGENGVLVSAGDEWTFTERSVEVGTSAVRMDAIRSAAHSSVSHLHWGAINDRFAHLLATVVERHAQVPAKGDSRKSALRVGGLTQKGLAHPDSASRP